MLKPLLKALQGTSQDKVLIPRERRDRSFLIFSVFFFFISLVTSIYYFSRVYQPWGISWTDFTVFHRAGIRIIKGDAIYNLSDGLDVYKYSPPFAYFMVLFTKMHMHKAVFLWYSLVFILILSSIYFIKQTILHYYKEKTLPKYFYFISFFLTLRFFLTLISRMQSDFLVLFFLALCIWLLHYKKEALSGFALATAILVKLTPLIFIPYFIYRKFYKLTFACIAGILFYLWLPCLNLGWHKNIVYIKNWVNTLSVTTGELILWYKNQSLLSCISRLFSENSSVKLFVLPPLIIKGIFIIVSISMVFFILYFCRRLAIYKKREFGYNHLLEFSLILICMVLFSPLAWKHTFLHLLIPHMALIYYLLKYPQDFMVKSLLVLSFILNSVLNPEVLRSYNQIVSLYSNMTWGTLILAVALLRVAYKSIKE